MKTDIILESEVLPTEISFTVDNQSTIYPIHIHVMFLILIVIFLYIRTLFFVKRRRNNNQSLKEMTQYFNNYLLKK